MFKKSPFQKTRKRNGYRALLYIRKKRENKGSIRWLEGTKNVFDAYFIGELKQHLQIRKRGKKYQEKCGYLAEREREREAHEWKIAVTEHAGNGRSTDPGKDSFGEDSWRRKFHIRG